MNDDSTRGGGVGALLGVLLLFVLLFGGTGFYLFTVRQQQVVAAERARLAEAQAIAEARTAHAEKALADAEEKRARGEAEAGGQESGVGGQESGEAIRAAIEAVLRAQQEAWNRGDVDAFVEHYWKSDDVTFSSGGKTTRGWEETVRGYRERYPTRTAMGQLTFGKLEITPLSGGAALVLGKWRLERESGPVSGNFSLVFRKLDGRWVIVHDHTSRVVE